MSTSNNVERKYYNYMSYSGSDIVCVIGNTVFAELQSISISVTREKGPLYTMDGSPNPTAFGRNKRAIAGTMSFVNFNSSALIEHIEQYAPDKSNFFANKGDVSAAEGYGSSSQSYQLFNNVASNASSQSVESPNDLRQKTTAWYADQIMPFNINITASNEAGASMKRTVVGVEILNQGAGFSVDDTVLEEQVTFLARDLTKWIPVANQGGTPVSSTASTTTV